ncbi:hypothetical protein V8E36_008978 [Tilletia maclaganii]
MQPSTSSSSSSIDLPASWQPPAAPISPDEPFLLRPSEIYPTGDDSGVPIFRPTWEQFKDFNTYVRRIIKEGMTSGIVKIIPPSVWLQMQSDFSGPLANFSIETPDKQQRVSMGAGTGIYQQNNVLSEDDYSIDDWIAKCQSEKHRAPYLKKIQKKLKEQRQKRVGPNTSAATSTTLNIDIDADKADSQTRPGRTSAARSSSKTARTSLPFPDPSNAPASIQCALSS